MRDVEDLTNADREGKGKVILGIEVLSYIIPIALNECDPGFRDWNPGIHGNPIQFTHQV